MNRKNVLLVALALAVVLVGVVLYGVYNRPTPPTQIVIAENITVVSAPVTVARTKGYFASEGLAEKTVPFASGRLALDALLGGKAQFATVAETPIVLAAMQGRPIRVLCTITSSETNTKILARKDRGVSKLSDLRGERVAATKGTNGEYFLSLALQNGGLTMSDIEFTQMNPPDMPSAIIRGDVDAICTWEPHIWNARKELGDNAVLLGNNPGQYTQTFNIVVMEDFARDHPEILKAFLKALLKSELFMRDSRDEALSLVAKANNMSVSDLTAIWPDYDFSVTLKKGLSNALTGQAEWAKKTKLVPTSASLPPLDHLLLEEPLVEVNNLAVDLD